MHIATTMAIDDLGAVLATLGTAQFIADLLNTTLCADDDERLTDYQAELARRLHERLCELRPECIDIASGHGE